jgi:protein-S-isoprenylcysteine O-methyltransferase Ste14
MTEPRTFSNPAERPKIFPWPPMLFIGAIAAAVAMTGAWPLPWPGLNDAPAHWVGLGFGAIGLALIVFAVRTLRAHGTTVRPDPTSTTLVTSGPYARFRNPIYLGAVLLLFGAAEITKSIWFVAAGVGFAVLVTALQILPEERHLESQFGDAYLEYKSRTRRWI